MSMNMQSFRAMHFPADGRQPHLVDLTTSPVTQFDPQTGQPVVVSTMPHPEIHMDTSENAQMRQWRWQFINALDEMRKNFEKPYIIFYPLADRAGKALPMNQGIRNIQGKNYSSKIEWRGDIVIAKFRGGVGDPFSSLINISMADYPIVKNYLSTKGPESEQYIQAFYQA